MERKEDFLLHIFLERDVVENVRTINDIRRRDKIYGI